MSAFSAERVTLRQVRKAMPFLSVLTSWRDILDIILVTFLIYRVVVLLKGSRALTAIYGLLVIGLVYVLSQNIGLYTLNWILENFLGSLFLVIIILFQREIRSALSAVGSRRLFTKTVVEEAFLDEILAAALFMAQRRIGALIVIEKNTPLGDLMERGVITNSKLSKELLTTIFFPNTALHDGAVIVRNGKIFAAGCILPLAQSIQDHREYGTRHRAAIGVTEESDAIALVVSEERGTIRIAVSGRLTGELDSIHVKRTLRSALERK